MQLWGKLQKVGLLAQSAKGLIAIVAAIPAVAVILFGLIEGQPWSHLIILTLLGTASAAWLAYGILGVVERLNQTFPNFFSALRHDHEKFEAINSEHDSLHDARVRYWKILRASFEGRGNLEALIDLSEIPELDVDRPDFSKWEQELSAESQDLWKLVCWASFRDDDRSLPDHGELRKLQGLLSNYWAKAGTMMIKDRSISQSKMHEQHIPHQLRLMKLLVLGECSIEIAVKSQKIRKPFLFRAYWNAHAYERARLADLGTIDTTH